ncbi:hypothetical protein UFOVP318_40 [uncultured Caudovirales phage]|uniref:Uncharacterized protein n=1 Tax=uncultured Caudovirales phage TaxID=2100421 RepID=A0A6J5LSG0_9CAUD|nr:hypothetical protein UFOVP318_40 [uncultured Caudovirales phage]
MNKLPEAAAKECAERYPVKESVDSVILVDSALLKNYESEFMVMASLIDSLLSAKCDTVTKIKIKELIKTLPAKVQTKVITRTIENTAQVQVLRDSLANVSAKHLEADTKAQNYATRITSLKKQIGWMWIIILLAAIIIGRSFYKL